MLHAVEAWLRATAVRIHEQAPSLTALDQAIGDGDHGINLDRGFSAVVKAMDARPQPDGDTSDAAASAELVRLVGRTLISTVGGAAGPLYGTGFVRASAAIAALPAEPPPSDGLAFVTALEAAATGISALGKATTGEKTMLDALMPAAVAARAAFDRGDDAGSVVGAARDAARAGAAATVPMLATKGRASYLGERSIGHQDPGATSAALLLDVLAGVLADAVA
ncbi:MAG TPA: dihydroxyacetone kinase subunit DhaL [Candidatus Limnocylindrales bacterium]|jgi:dihydroxyacetone kinase-like protein|nr:dihydroxyacetone kinase subunit DhaL [Candidatus Limnocylindrales bacterium]